VVVHNEVCVNQYYSFGIPPLYKLDDFAEIKYVIHLIPPVLGYANGYSRDGLWCGLLLGSSLSIILPCLSMFGFHPHPDPLPSRERAKRGILHCVQNDGRAGCKLQEGRRDSSLCSE